MATATLCRVASTLSSAAKAALIEPMLSARMTVRRENIIRDKLHGIGFVARLPVGTTIQTKLKAKK